MLSSLGFGTALKAALVQLFYLFFLLFLTTLFGIGFACLLSPFVSETTSVFSRILEVLFSPSVVLLINRLRGAQ